MQEEIEKSKQDALNKAADDAANKVEQNNEGFIKPWFLEITGQAKKDREAAIKAANDAYNNAVAQAAKDAQEYDAKQTIVYNQLDQGIKNSLTAGTSALQKADAILNDSANNIGNVGKLVAGGMGLYCTKIHSSNGGIKMAFHNNQNLSSSSKIWYITDTAIVWTNNASGVTINNIDAYARTWPNAISSGGSMVMNEITAKRITGEMIATTAIVARHIAAGAIVSDKIAANAIVASKIMAG